MGKVNDVITIQQSVENVFLEAQNIEQLAKFLPDLQEVRILKKNMNEVDSFWKGSFQGREVKWTERDIWDEANKECRFFILEGDFKVYQGMWKFIPLSDKETKVELEIEYDLGLPLVGALINTFLKKKMLENAQAMLKALKQMIDQA
ncbi:MAG: type II toxin-antitoxin system RatA family toxin [Atribacter sp.]|jgi:coenzyme Q-binding protein COQ10|uniref:Ribosome association toxin RatA n=1 Tax=Candidatus Atribacter allofermentans TaxID=1852833 RepID=A0A1V5SPG8_9BACT|nr:MAG: Ribosome association toxin RatA [Candidatus Atribacteria bacterium ADurb.Bin276]